jgi:hypothetical protein
MPAPFRLCHSHVFAIALLAFLLALPAEKSAAQQTHEMTSAPLEVRLQTDPYAFRVSEAAGGDVLLRKNQTAFRLGGTRYEAAATTEVNERSGDVLAATLALADTAATARLPLEYPDDPAVADMWNQYVYGPSLLVAPVSREGVCERAVYLPEGDWLDYNDKETVFRGGQTVTASSRARSRCTASATPASPPRRTGRSRGSFTTPRKPPRPAGSG